ncbi:hypothetical protein AA21291_0486 [Swaminathania salitolerans LMG 21291]|uniref:Uncharacterized protein n=1 Tax=Swaminathania salitolerans TaxID=182838 RepID=A0A511BM65_9PROT|nr:hypothetical protein AA21291_0486 [Swaminathania salitolerans LMG 21291]GEL01345.1 hypothetical protein SSA02_05080 [Swaminathania salitolerans]
MHQNQIGRFGELRERFQTGADAVLSLPSAGDRRETRHTLERLHEPRIVADRLYDADMTAKRFGGMSDDWLAAEQDILLRKRVRGGERAGIGEAATRTGSEKNGSNTHDGQGMRICGQGVKPKNDVPTAT